jgi:hypothetical protein
MMIYEIREFSKYHKIKDHIFNNSWLIYLSYFFFFWSGLILVINIIKNGGLSVTDIRGLNALYLGILLLCLDSSEKVNLLKVFIKVD